MGYDLHIERTRSFPTRSRRQSASRSGVRQLPRLKVSACSPATFMAFAIRKPVSMSEFGREMAMPRSSFQMKNNGTVFFIGLRGL